MKKTIILIAQTLGYFRAKTDEKKAKIFDEMALLEDFSDVSRETLEETLQGETLRRHVVSQNRADKAVDKAINDASKPLSAGVNSAFEHIEEYPQGRYVLTTAQNNTDVDQEFLGAVLTYCNHVGATLLVAKTTYNKNGFQVALDVKDGIYYDHSIVPYLVEGHISLGGPIDFIGSANVLPTTKNPLVGFESVTKYGVNVVIPATKIALKCTASLKGGKGKRLFSTGSVTLRNYVLRKAGAVASSDHNIGALFVDTTGEGCIVRQLEKMAGSDGFYDEGSYFTASSISNNVYPIAIQFGDIHAEKMEDGNLEKMVDLIDYYQPENIFLHDVADFSSRNHHNVKCAAFIFNQSVQGNTVAGDLRAVARVIDRLSDNDGMVHIVESNHDLAINTYLKNEDFKDDPVNALTYLECMLALYKHIELHHNTDFNMLKFAVNKIGGLVNTEVIFHGTDESIILAGVEMGCHGHSGTNGSRGSPAQFRALGIPMNTGHTHTPSILGGCYTAGVSATLEMGYNIGASSWALANTLTWPNGQRQIIFMD